MDWVNSMAVLEKADGSLCICLDPSHLNKAIKREHFQLPTIEDITTRMTNAKWFTKLDANRGHWKIPLDEESQLLSDLEGVQTYIDDIIVHAETEAKHDQRLHSVLERCEKIKSTLNKEKSVFKCKEVTYIGHKLTQEGIKPDDAKIRTISEMPAPSDKKGVAEISWNCELLTKVHYQFFNSHWAHPYGKTLNLSGHMNWTKHFEKLKKSSLRIEVQF